MTREDLLKLRIRCLRFRKFSRGGLSDPPSTPLRLKYLDPPGREWGGGQIKRPTNPETVKKLQLRQRLMSRALQTRHHKRFLLTLRFRAVKMNRVGFSLSTRPKSTWARAQLLPRTHCSGGYWATSRFRKAEIDGIGSMNPAQQKQQQRQQQPSRAAGPEIGARPDNCPERVH